MINILMVALSLLCLNNIATAASSANDELKAFTSEKRTFIPLWTKSVEIPTLVILIDTDLYFSTASGNTQCPGKDLFHVSAKAGVEKKVAEIPCVHSLQNFDQKLFVEFLETQPGPQSTGNFIPGLQIAHWNGDRLERDLETSFKGMEQFKGQIAAAMHGVGDRDYEPARGRELRKAIQIQGQIITMREKMPGLLLKLTGPEGALPWMPVVGWFSLLDPEAEPVLNSVKDWKGANVSSMIVSPTGNLLALRHLEAGHSVIDEVDPMSAAIVRSHSHTFGHKGEDGQEKATEIAKMLRPLHLTKTEHGAILFDAPDRPGIENRSFYFSMANNHLNVANFPVRAFGGAGQAPGGVAVISTQRIYWYGPEVDKLPMASSWAALNSDDSIPACAGVAIRKGPTDTSRRIYLQHKIGSGVRPAPTTKKAKEEIAFSELEMAYLGEFSDIVPGGLVCHNGSLAVIAKSFLPRLAPQNLELKVTPVTTKTANATNNPKTLELVALANNYLGKDWKDLAITSKTPETNLLFVMEKSQLKFVREPPSGGQFASVKVGPEFKEVFEINFLGDGGAEWDYRAVVRGDGTGYLGRNLPGKAEAK